MAKKDAQQPAAPPMANIPKAPFGGRIGDAKWPFVFSILIFLAVLAVWAALYFLNQNIDSKISDLDQQTKNLQTSENDQATTRIIGLEKEINDAKKLLASHVYSSKGFGALESLTLPNVQLNNLNLDIKGGKASFGGRTETYNSLARQMLVFENATSTVRGINVSGISLNQSGGIGFSMNLDLNPGLFNNK